MKIKDKCVPLSLIYHKYVLTNILAMIKRSILGLACAMFLGVSAFAQNSQEVVTTPDPSQGYLLNRFADNWFITGEGGASLLMSQFDQHRKLSDRFAPAASVYVGKWFSPIIGLRIGANYMGAKSLSQVNVWTNGAPKVNGYYKQYFNEFGAVGDVMINLTNWWCGYRPGRIYNSSVYFGGGAYWTVARNDAKGGDWENAHNFNTSLRAGWINAFNVSKSVQLFLDIRYSTLDNPRDRVEIQKKTCGDLQAYVGVTYNFNKRTWDAPVVPVCPEVPDCSAIEARLQAANARIADLERQLQDCLNRPVEKAPCAKLPLATIYYPINKSSLSTREVNVLRAVASVMKESGKNYTLTGWAYNYTGTESFNDRLRHARVNGVQRQLVRFGVDESKLNATVNNGNLTDLGEKAVQLDRAVTIEEAE